MSIPIIPLKTKKSIFDGKKIITFDSEAYRYKTDGYEKQELAIYVFYDGRNYRYGFDLDNFLNDIKYYLDTYHNIILIAHNISYDLSLIGFIKHIIGSEPLFNLPQTYKILSGVVYVSYSNKNKSIEFLDSFNFFKTKLHKLAEMLNENKTFDEEYDYDPEQWNKLLKTDNNDLKMCKTDCKILWDVIDTMAKQKDILWSVSAPSSAFKSFKYFYQNRNIYLGDYNNIALLSYRGGRNEIYTLRPYDNVIDLDINSLYPYAMIKYKYSYSLHKHITPDPDLLIYNIDNEKYNYLMNVDFSCDYNIERMPVVVKIGGKLMQVKSSKNEWITGREYSHLVKEHVNVKINDCYEFNNMDMFTSYINHFYKLKSDSKGVKREFYKLMLNSLYGKFGQHKSIHHFDSLDIFNEYEKNLILNNKDRSYMRINGVNYSLYDGFVSYSEKIDPEYAVLIASEITANARLYNYDIQKQIGFKNVIYTDTDSFFVINKTKDDLKDFINDNILGLMKIENFGYFEGYAPKNYLFVHDGEKYRKLKGIKSKAKILDKDKYQQSIIIPFKNKYGYVVSKDIIKIDIHMNDKMDFTDPYNPRIFNDVTDYENYKEKIKTK